MYPLVVVLGVGVAEARPAVWRTVLPLAVPGFVVAAYHSYLQATTVACGFEGDCAAVLWRAPVVGLTIPNLSLLAFGLVAGLGGVVAARERGLLG
jgi:disulfide bond formation protein DsbB